MDVSGTNLLLRQAYVQSARLAGRYSIGAMSAQGPRRLSEVMPASRLLPGARYHVRHAALRFGHSRHSHPSGCEAATVVRDQLSSRAREEQVRVGKSYNILASDPGCRRGPRGFLHAATPQNEDALADGDLTAELQR
jgi:hypothetical protein